MIKEEIRSFIRGDVLPRFLRYVAIHTTSDEDSTTHPSTACQFDLGRLLVEELKGMGVSGAEMDEYGYVYAVLPATPGYDSTDPDSLGFCAHLDTSPAVSGKNVKPVIHPHYQGEVITYPADPGLKLDPEDCPALRQFIGEDIITSSGDTLLGADDKAGIAEIMSALAAMVRFPELRHPEIRICFTPDEEIGQGTAKIQISRMGKVSYTLDGGIIGELENECFDAYGAKIRFKGLNVHPGEAKNKMINAGAIAARYLAAMPEWQTPEHTELREGFFHLTRMHGDENQAELQFIIRDFIHAENLKRIELLHSLKDYFMHRYPGLEIDVETREQYRNMNEVLCRHPETVDMAKKAIENAGLRVIQKAIRGGTDGARLSFMGIPTPNLFAGGLLFHSLKEWIPVMALEKAAEVILGVSELWYDRSQSAT
ncbi:MAG: peptidase T [Candidatus Delongbacteria bacterium]|nr:peptidase T [Candidatus Delongbacteria bacterium]